MNWTSYILMTFLHFVCLIFILSKQDFCVIGLNSILKLGWKLVPCFSLCFSLTNFMISGHSMTELIKMSSNIINQTFFKAQCILSDSDKILISRIFATRITLAYITIGAAANSHENDAALYKFLIPRIIYFIFCGILTTMMVSFNIFISILAKYFEAIALMSGVASLVSWTNFPYPVN